MTHGSATVPDPLQRHDVGACELPLPRELEPVAFAMRHEPCPSGAAQRCLPHFPVCGLGSTGLTGLLAETEAADLSGADLRHADFRGADLVGVSLGVSDLRHADFSTAALSRTYFSGSCLSGARFARADAGALYFDPENVLRTDFSDAVGRNVDFSAARLKLANFKEPGSQMSTCEGPRPWVCCGRRDGPLPGSQPARRGLAATAAVTGFKPLDGGDGSKPIDGPTDPRRRNLDRIRGHRSSPCKDIEPVAPDLGIQFASLRIYPHPAHTRAGRGGIRGASARRPARRG